MATHTHNTDTTLTPDERAMLLEEANIYRAAIREHESSSACSREGLLVLARRMHPGVTFSRQTFGLDVEPSIPDAMPEHVAVRVQSTFLNDRWLTMPVARWHRWMAAHYRRELAKLAKLASEYSFRIHAGS